MFDVGLNFLEAAYSSDEGGTHNIMQTSYATVTKKGLPVGVPDTSRFPTWVVLRIHECTDNESKLQSLCFPCAPRIPVTLSHKPSIVSPED